MTTPNTAAEDTTKNSDGTGRLLASTFDPTFAAYNQKFRAAVAERGTPQAKALYAALQLSSQQKPKKKVPPLHQPARQGLDA